MTLGEKIRSLMTDKMLGLIIFFADILIVLIFVFFNRTKKGAKYEV